MKSTSTGVGVVANAQRVMISVTSRNTTETIVQIGVPDTSDDYGVLIPTPSEPTLDMTPISEESLDALDEQTRPTIVKEYYTVTGGGGGDGSSGCACLPVAGSAKGGVDRANSSSQGSVTASQPANIGPVTATVVTATDATALNAWLDANGFVIPDERQDLVAKYVGANRYFIALKRNDTAAPGGPTSIGLHYSLKGDHRLLSLAFARLGAAPTVAFTVFLFTPTPMIPSAPFQALSLEELDDGLLSGDYEGALQAAVKAHGGKAFVLENSFAQAGLLTEALFPENAVDYANGLVRMSTVVAADDLTEDATFFTPADGPIQSRRTVTIYDAAPKTASLGLWGLVALGWGLRRRRRA